MTTELGAFWIGQPPAKALFHSCTLWSIESLSSTHVPHDVASAALQEQPAAFAMISMIHLADTRAVEQFPLFICSQWTFSPAAGNEYHHPPPPVWGPSGLHSRPAEVVADVLECLLILHLYSLEFGAWLHISYLPQASTDTCTTSTNPVS